MARLFRQEYYKLTLADLEEVLQGTGMEDELSLPYFQFVTILSGHDRASMPPLLLYLLLICDAYFHVQAKQLSVMASI